jgi:hypothetical protein
MILFITPAVKTSNPIKYGGLRENIQDIADSLCNTSTLKISEEVEISKIKYSKLSTKVINKVTLIAARSITFLIIYIYVGLCIQMAENFV